MPILLLAVLFLVTAIAYASVGFGGGSTYNALLVLSGTDYRLIPAIALTCNILVVTGGVIHHLRAGHMTWTTLLPYVVLSIPMAWLGGRIAVSETLFIGLLGFGLLLAAVQMLVRPQTGIAVDVPTGSSLWLKAMPVGGVIGFLAGITGIGGGIFLAPIIYLLKLAPPRIIAGITSGFILLNSVSGLTGQMMKSGNYSLINGMIEAWPLFVFVVIGGQIGSRLGIYTLPERWIKRLTAVLILYVAVRLIWRWFALVSA